LHARQSARYPFLLESVAHGNAQSRFDILFAWPGDSLAASHDSNGTGQGIVSPEAFLDALDAAWLAERLPPGEPACCHDLPFCGGWFIYLAYEFGAVIERSVPLRGDGAFPLAVATRIGGAIIRDHVTGRTIAVVDAPDAEQRLVTMLADAAETKPVAEWKVFAVATPMDADPAEFLDGVARIQEYIRAGDVFQVNLSRAWQVRLSMPVTPAALYTRLRAVNPAPFAGLAVLPDGSAIISSSPERLFSVRAGEIATRPIAGTWRRGDSANDDRMRAEALLAHPKERAEHVMLLDLERNDLGRVCIPGSVRVSELMVVETYPHIHHIVSNITGRLRAEITPGQIIRATFPGGTITGCPKVRTMQIIAELEPDARGAYTGSMGYLDRNGDMDMNILIRTLSQKAESVTFRTGAGIVADSVPERELDETRAKARGMLEVFGSRRPE
jgi:anthranilate synthase component 1